MKNMRRVVVILIIFLTIGLGIVFLVEHFRTPDIHAMEKMIFLILASALLPAGVLWSIEHYFLVRPLENEYMTIIDRLNSKIDDTETFESIRNHGLRAISSAREPLVKEVLEGSLTNIAIKEIIIVGSTQDGLIRRTPWFEEFIKGALERKKQLKLMFTHWDYVTHRERQEDRPDGAIAQELQNSLSALLRWGVPKDSIRLAYGAPTVFMVIAGTNMILNPYPFCGESVTSMSIWLENLNADKPEGQPGSLWHQYYINHYDKPWNPDKPQYRRRNNKDPKAISYPLADDWENQISRFVEGIVRERFVASSASPIGKAK